MTPTRTIFESFNARLLDPRDVAGTFVPPRYYRQLLKRCHTIIVGPRGSGKTTLLKMLQQPALEAWSHADADECRAAVDFTGVFVPADRAWGAQVASLGEGVLSEEHRNLIGRCALTTHVLRALVLAMEYRAHPDKAGVTPHRRVHITEADEAELVMSVSDPWSITPRVPSFFGLKQALSARLSDLEKLVSAEKVHGAEGRSERLASTDFLHLHFLPAASLAIESFDVLDTDHRGKWAFLFDELELAPRWIREELIFSLRSIDARIMFKLSLCPFSEDIRLFKNALSPMEEHDYETIPLWYPQKENGYEFCNALLQSMLLAHGLGNVDPIDLFGRSEFETLSPEDKRASPYRPNSRGHRRFSELSDSDRTFRRYLKKQHIDLSKLHLLEESERAADIRKITAIVAARGAFRAADRRGAATGTVPGRSRKRPVLYHGASALFSMVEGNPRWLIGIVSPLLRDLEEGKKISRPDQTQAVRRAQRSFRALLRTIPCPELPGKRRSRGLLGLLDSVGEFFFERVVKDDFNADPPGTFLIDVNVGEALERGLAEALNTGAIVYVPDKDSELVLPSLKRKRFRLSYILAPHYKIPMRLGRQIALSRILFGDSPRHESSLQQDLFRGG